MPRLRCYRLTLLSADAASGQLNHGSNGSDPGAATHFYPWAQSARLLLIALQLEEGKLRRSMGSIVNLTKGYTTSNRDRRLDCMQAGEPRKHKSCKDNCATKGSAIQKTQANKQSKAPLGASVQRSVQTHTHAGSATRHWRLCSLSTLPLATRLACSWRKGN